MVSEETLDARLLAVQKCATYEQQCALFTVEELRELREGLGQRRRIREAVMKTHRKAYKKAKVKHAMACRRYDMAKYSVEEHPKNLGRTNRLWLRFRALFRKNGVTVRGEGNLFFLHKDVARLRGVVDTFFAGLDPPQQPFAPEIRDYIKEQMPDIEIMGFVDKPFIHAAFTFDSIHLFFEEDYTVKAVAPDLWGDSCTGAPCNISFPVSFLEDE
jgi:hypothetical protein